MSEGAWTASSDRPDGAGAGRFDPIFGPSVDALGFAVAQRWIVSAFEDPLDPAIDAARAAADRPPPADPPPDDEAPDQGEEEDAGEEDGPKADEPADAAGVLRIASWPAEWRPSGADVAERGATGDDAITRAMRSA